MRYLLGLLLISLMCFGLGCSEADNQEEFVSSNAALSWDADNWHSEVFVPLKQDPTVHFSLYNNLYNAPLTVYFTLYTYYGQEVQIGSVVTPVGGGAVEYEFDTDANSCFGLCTMKIHTTSPQGVMGVGLFRGTVRSELFGTLTSLQAASFTNQGATEYSIPFHGSPSSSGDPWDDDIQISMFNPGSASATVAVSVSDDEAGDEETFSYTIPAKTSTHKSFNDRDHAGRIHIDSDLPLQVVVINERVEPPTGNLMVPGTFMFYPEAISSSDNHVVTFGGDLEVHVGLLRPTPPVIETSNSAPFTLTSADTLMLSVNGEPITCPFQTKTYNQLQMRSALEECLYVEPATAFMSGTNQLSIRTLDSIQVIGGTANTVLGFPTTRFSYTDNGGSVPSYYEMLLKNTSTSLAVWDETTDYPTTAGYFYYHEQV